MGMLRRQPVHINYNFYVVDKGTISRNPPTCEYTLQDRIRQLEQFREQEEQANLHYIEVDNNEFTPSVHQAALTMDMLDARDTFPKRPTTSLNRHDILHGIIAQRRDCFQHI
ncbi:unnamed protein product [Sphagnum tenellum]